MTDREKLIEILSVPIYPHEQADPVEVVADYLLSNGVTFATDTNVLGELSGNSELFKWISVEDEKPKEFVSVLGHMTDAGDFPAVRECYLVGNVFFFPSLRDRHPVDKWMPMPEGE